MAIATNINDLTGNVGLICLNNGTSSVSIQSNFPVFDSSFPTDYLVDVLITSMNGFTPNETIEVLVDTVSMGSFYISSTPEKTIWLSELMGLTSRDILSSKPTNQTIQLNYSSNKLLEFELISAKASDYISAVTTYNNIDTLSNNLILAKSEIQTKDENSLSALRSAINTTKTTISGNSTNVITITNEFETFGSALDKTLVVDDLITFSKALNIGTQIYIKKDDVYITTYTCKSNINSIWLSELIGLSNRDFLYQKSNKEVYELTFIYDTQINNQVICGVLTNFVSASVASVQLTQNLYELSNAKALDNIPIETSDCNYVVTYDGDNKIKSAVYQINSDQLINYDFVCDNSGDTPKYLVRQSNVDKIYNISIDVVMDYEGIVNEINMLRNLAREMINKNSSTTITS
jgi:hypothetical protein